MDGASLDWLGPIWNFEHIFDSAHHQPNVDLAEADIFEPRQERAPTSLHPVSASSAILNMPATPFWGLESRTRVTVEAPNYIDIRFSARLTRPSPKSPWFGLFWATYVEKPGSELLFPGQLGEGPMHWVRGSSPAHMVRSTWPHTEQTGPVEFVRGYPDRLFTASSLGAETWSLPLAYGVVDDVVFAYFLKQGRDARLTQSPLTAWDVQRVVHNWEVGVCYTFDQRLLVATFESREKVLQEYESWSGRTVPDLGPPVDSSR